MGIVLVYSSGVRKGRSSGRGSKARENDAREREEF